jgi:hypothetical protein
MSGTLKIGPLFIWQRSNNCVVHVNLLQASALDIRQITAWRDLWKIFPILWTLVELLTGALAGYVYYF